MYDAIGAGSYEPAGTAARRRGAVRGATAERLPFEDQSFDAAMALATVVVLTYDVSESDRFWLNRDYLPEYAGLWAGRPSLTELAGVIGARIEPVLVPWDCADGFYLAYWRRPEAYLDEQLRRGMSIWARVGPDAEQRVVHSLRDDLASGRWAERNRDLVDLDAAELGQRLLIG